MQRRVCAINDWCFMTTSVLLRKLCYPNCWQKQLLSYAISTGTTYSGYALRTVVSADAWDHCVTVLIETGTDVRPMFWRVDRVTNALYRTPTATELSTVGA